MVIPINTSKFNAAAKQYVNDLIYPGIELDVVNIKHGFPAIQSRFSLDRNAQYVANLVQKKGRRYLGVFVSDFDGCGVEACQEILTIPVIDAFRPQAAVAITLAQSFSIITPHDSLLGLDASHPRAMGLENYLASVRPINLTVEQMGETDEVVERVYEASRAAIKEDGAQSIILGCSAMMNVAGPVAERLRNEAGYNVPVMDPNRIAIMYLQMLIAAKLCQSKVCYPTPRELIPRKLTSESASNGTSPSRAAKGARASRVR